MAVEAGASGPANPPRLFPSTVPGVRGAQNTAKPKGEKEPSSLSLTAGRPLAKSKTLERVKKALTQRVRVAM